MKKKPCRENRELVIGTTNSGLELIAEYYVKDGKCYQEPRRWDQISVKLGEKVEP